MQGAQPDSSGIEYFGKNPSTGMTNYDEDSVAPSVASSSQFNSPPPELKSSWGEEEAALLAMEDSVVNEVARLTQKSSISSLEQVPRNLIRYSEVLAQQGKSERLWTRVKQAIELCLHDSRERLADIEMSKDYLNVVVDVVQKHVAVLSTLAKVFSLVSGSGPKDTRFLSMEIICGVILCDEEILSRTSTVYMCVFDSILSGDADPASQERVKNATTFSAMVSGQAYSSILDLLIKSMAQSGIELLNKQLRLRSSDRKDRLLLRQCQLMANWMRSVRHAWHTVGLDKGSEGGKAFDKAVHGVVIKFEELWRSFLPVALMQNNERALKGFQQILTQQNDTKTFADASVLSALVEVCKDVVATEPMPIERAAIFQRLHALIQRCPLQDSATYPIKAVWKTVIAEAAIGVTLFGQDLARFMMLELVASARDQQHFEKRMWRILHAGDLASVLEESGRDAFVKEVLAELKSALLPRPDGLTFDFELEARRVVVAALEMSSPKYGYFAKILLNDYDVSRKLSSGNALIGNRAAWHLDYQTTAQPDTEIQSKYEALYEDRKVFVSEALSMTGLTINGEPVTVSRVQLAIIKHLQGTTSTYKGLVNGLPYGRPEIRNALVDMLSPRTAILVWYSSAPGKAFKKDDVFALNPTFSAGTKYACRLRLASEEIEEED